MTPALIHSVTLPAEALTWIEEGRTLVSKRQEIDWALSDWMHTGKQAGYLEQTKFDFLSEQLGISPKALKDASKAADRFPPALRDRTLSVEHHAIVASLPQDEGLALLKKASAEKLKPQDLREAVTQHRYTHGEMFEDDDVDSTLATHIIRAWNRATPAAREQFMEVAVLVGYGILDEDRCYG